MMELIRRTFLLKLTMKVIVMKFLMKAIVVEVLIKTKTIKMIIMKIVTLRNLVTAKIGNKTTDSSTDDIVAEKTSKQKIKKKQPDQKWCW